MADNPYLKTYEHITDLRKFLQYDPKTKTMTFIGKTLEARVPKRFEVYNLLNISETVEALGVMDLIIDDTYQASLHLLALITVETNDITNITIDGTEYVVLHLEHGDKLISHTQVVRNPNVIYGLYVEFITRGRMLYTLTYEDLNKLFDSSAKMCGSKIPVDHVIFEVIYSHLARDPDNKYIQYRHSDRTDGKFEFVPLRSVGLAPDGTTSRILGSYFDEGVNSSLIYENDTRHPFEDLLRGIPIEREEPTEEKT